MATYTSVQQDYVVVVSSPQGKSPPPTPTQNTITFPLPRPPPTIIPLSPGEMAFG